MNLPNLREASTKRGIVWMVGGVWVLIQAARGQSVNPDALFDKLDFWLGVVMTVSGTFGLLPDEPKNVRIELPPVERVWQPQGYNDANQNVGETPVYPLGRAGADVAAQSPGVRRAGAGAERGDPAADGLRPPVPSHPGPDADTQPSGWYGSGWGDK